MSHAQEPWVEERCRRIGVILAGPGDDSPADSADSPADPAEGHAREARVCGAQELSDMRLSSGQARTLAALERVFPVRFERVESSLPDGLDGTLVLGPPSLAQSMGRLPRLVLPADAGQKRAHAGPPRAVTHTGTQAAWTHETTAVVLANEPWLARPLRGRVIHEQALPVELAPDGSGVTLAEREGRPVWWRLGGGSEAMEVSAFPLAHLHEGEALREHLRAERFMGLLPLVSFLSRLLGEDGWRLPPLRASFVVDDPNLHWTSYGFLNYAELIEHASQHGYHMGFATVPLDGWLVRRKAASLLAENPSVLSLLVHGNDHVARELGRLSTDVAAEASIAQGLRRIAALERRSGLKVERVIVPPHGACSEAALRATFRLGGEAACISRPYPWLDGQSAPTPLAGWHPAELVAGGLPVLPRHPLSASREDLALRALLGQPLILYGHHVDFADGLDLLAQATSEIDSLGDVQWGSLSWIARGNYSTRRSEETLLVKMHSRRVAVEIPSGIRELRVMIDEPVGGAAGHRLTHASGSIDIGFEQGIGVSGPLTIEGASRIDLRLKADRPLDPAEGDSRAIRPWPLLRRVLVETRDRLQLTQKFPVAKDV